MKLELNVTDELLEELADRLLPILKDREQKPQPSYKISEAAPLLKISGESIRLQMLAGTIARVPSIGQYRIPAWEMDRLLKEQEEEE